MLLGVNIIVIMCASFFLFREEFKVHFPDQSLETSHPPQSVLRLLEGASKTLMIESFKIHKAQTEVAPVCMPYVGYVYTRMFWSK